MALMCHNSLVYTSTMGFILIQQDISYIMILFIQNCRTY